MQNDEYRFMTAQPSTASNAAQSGWPRRSVLKAGALAVGVASSGDSPMPAPKDCPAVTTRAGRLGMGQAIRSGELQPADLLAAARRQAVNGRVKAVNMLHEDYARRVGPASRRRY
jgi:hypothetical protein